MDYNGSNVSCFGAQDGSITANVTGGTPPYHYYWSNQEQTQTISNLEAGFYNVEVVDSNGNKTESGINLESAEPLKVGLESPVYPNKYNVSCFQCFNGSITTLVSGGISPYTYTRKNETTTTQNRSNIGGGVYGLTVTRPITIGHTM